MDKILEYINEKSDNKFLSFVFEKGILSQDKTAIQLFFKYPKNTEKTDKIEELEVLCKQYFSNFELNVNVVLKEYTLQLDDLKNFCFQIVKSVLVDYIIADSDLTISFEKKSTILTIRCNKQIDKNILEQYQQEIKKQVFDKLNYQVEIQFLFDKIENTNVIESRVSKIKEDNMILETQQQGEFVKIDVIKNVCGELNDNVALLAGNFDGNEKITVAGTLQNFAVRETKGRSDGSQTESGDAEIKTKRYLSFALAYNDKTVRCTLFLTKGQEVLELENGKDYAVSGSVNSYNGTMSIIVKSIAECEIIAPKIAWRSCPKTYNYVTPEKFVQQEQIDLFFVDQMTKNEYLLNNTFVVYDLETTGINLSHDKIIDIGAFKIVNGKIVDKFSTFVNPDMPIPAEASKVNRITDDMVANFPNIDKILPDFYKFCYGSIIVGYNNVGFDDVFINREGRRLKYNFNNARNDVIALARANLPGLKNYKLGTVCANQSVPLVDAHRAVNDALATAKLFIKLAEKFC